MGFFRCTGRFVSWAGLTAVGAVHALWATGSPWPAKNRAKLADSVIGRKRLPGTEATVAVAVTATAAGAVAGGALGEGTPARLLRRVIGLALVARGAVPTDALMGVLGLPSASKRFRSMNDRYYRPLCLVLGVATLLGAQRRRG